MKKLHIPILLVFAAYCGNSAAAQDVYVYKGDDIKPISTLTNVQKITFGETGIDFLLDTGVSNLFSLNDLDYFTFFDREQSVGITDIVNGKNAVIKIIGNEIIVESTNPIQNVEIYSVEGVKMNSIKPRAKYSIIPISQYPTGIYLIKVETGGKTTTQKIIKK